MAFNPDHTALYVGCGDDNTIALYDIGSLRLLRRTLMSVLADHGGDQQPYHDGPVVRAVDINIIRAEFYRSYPAEGDEKAKQAARQRAFHRAINKAQDNDLIGVREIEEITYVWLARIQDCHAQNAYHNER